MVIKLMKQFVYKIALTNIPDLSERQNGSFAMIGNIFVALKHFPLLLSRYGLSTTLLKLLLKFLLRRNILYVVIYQNKIVSDGIISFGMCKYYRIGSKDCIIGPVFTDSNYRGKGFATFGLLSCLHGLKGNKSVTNVYIDTSEDNLAMQTVINKLNFICSDKTYNRNDWAL